MAFRLPVRCCLPVTPLPTPKTRSFSSTSPLLAKSTKQRLLFEHANIPAYPYPPSTVYKQSNFGLYGLQKIRFGNMVSSKNEIKTRRYWRPNVHKKRLWSEALQKMVRVRITARVLRTVDKVGGLDEYLLGGKARRIKELGMGGWKLRWRVMQTEGVREKFRREREELGLGVDAEEGMIGIEGGVKTRGEIEMEVRRFDEELERGEVLDVGEGLEDERGVVIGEVVEEKVEGGKTKLL